MLPTLPFSNFVPTKPLPTLFATSFLWLNGWLCHIWCLIRWFFASNLILYHTNKQKHISHPEVNRMAYPNQDLFWQFITCDNRTQSPSLFQTILHFYPNFQIFCSFLPIYNIFWVFSSFFWKVACIPLLSSSTMFLLFKIHWL